ncbi:MAG: exodeoxyribonuclease [Candidatus Midichloriaceae bacterium]|jgi:exodeoxyribonuclease-3|nr:exodeoxyribonuclease [Candidatus Midichloriaceae bacterium]
MIKIICWNLNSLKPRMQILEKVVAEHEPDAILMQEIKCTTENFPYMELESMGYNIAVLGQKTFNGVAIMSKSPIEDITRGIPDFADEQARYIECVTNLKGLTLRLASVYIPNGQEVGSDKFVYKMSFLRALREHLQNIKKFQEVCLVVGDYNVAPEDIDVHDPKKLEGKIGFHIDERMAFRSILNDGFYDAFRAKHPVMQEFSWWDYRGRSLSGNEGMRIDHVLASPEALDRVFDVEILKEYRNLEKPSDHAPILTVLRS